jgi:O-methyltransferase involved in polyketide biosynthesis
MAKSILSGIQWTLLIPLLSRARITARLSSLLYDPDAVRIIEILAGPFLISLFMQSISTHEK